MTVHSLRARFKETVSGAILDAAEEVAAEVGVPLTNLQAVAKRAGVAVGTIYNHFEDRNELFVELFTRRREELLDVVDGATKVAARSGFQTQLDVFVTAVLSYFDTRRTFLRLALEGQAPKPAVGKAFNTMEQLTLRAERIVKLGVKEKRLRAEAADLAPFFLTSAIRAVLIARAEGSASLAAHSAQVIALFLGGAGR